jgi:hypothetical protein
VFAEVIRLLGICKEISDAETRKCKGRTFITLFISISRSY